MKPPVYLPLHRSRDHEQLRQELRRDWIAECILRVLVVGTCLVALGTLARTWCPAECEAVLQTLQSYLP